MKAHPATELFPMMGDSELTELEEDIRQFGQQVPIVIHDGMILDGRNRWKACSALGVVPKTELWAGIGSPVEWVVSINLHRRHLNQSQRATIAVEMLPMLEAEALERKADAGRSAAPGRPAEKDVALMPHLSLVAQGEEISGESTIPPLAPPTPPVPVRARDQAAKAASVSPRYVGDAKKLKEQDPALFEQVREGVVSLPTAKRRYEEATTARYMENVANAVPGARERMERAGLKANFSSALYKTRHNLLTLDPEALTDVFEDDHVKAAQSFIRDCRSWLDALESAMRRGLRIVSRDESHG